jgi:hydrogenase-4 component F
MIASAAYLDAEWLKLAFVFIAIGFGTKMGLAPMHSWKPDTYSQAPSLVAGLMAGALTSCAFLGLARVCAISFAAGLGDFVRPVLIGFGLLSLLIAAAFIITQRDVKRLLAYSSVEHMGLLVIGVGVGGAGAYGAVLHSLNNGLAKCLLFLAVGNVVLAYGTSSVLNIRGLVSAVPRTAVLLVVGLVAVTGSPPFGLFISEFSILSGAFAGHFAWVGALTIFLLVVIFVGMGKMILDMVYGAPHPADPAKPRDHTLIAAADRSAFTLAPAVLAFLVLMLGVFIPAPLARVLTAAAAHLGGGTP